MDARFDASVEVFSTCPPSSIGDPATYLDRAVQVARWSEEAGCKGILVYSDNSQLDAWSVSHAILQHTSALCPLVAVQPIYMHPYSVAKTLASIAALWRRRLYLNMVAGGFKNDLTALNDTTPHDSRYDRLAEYTLIIRQLLESDRPVTFRGEFYQVENLRMTPPVAPRSGTGHLDLGVLRGGSGGGTTDRRDRHQVSEARRRRAGDRRTGSPDRDSRRCDRPPDRGRGLGCRARALPGGPQGPDHEAAGDEGLRLGLAQAALAIATIARRTACIGSCRSTTITPCVRISSAATTRSPARWRATSPTDSRTVILDVPPSLEELRHTCAAFGLALQPVQ